MKVIAFFMVICMSLVSVLTVKVQAMQYGKEPKCCIQTGTTVPCKSHKSDKAMGMCLTKLCCNVPGFSVNAAVEIVPVIPLYIKSSSAYPVHASTIDFSFAFWHPPKIVLF